MALVSDRPQAKRLKQYGVDIQTDFWDEHAVRVRKTDGTRHDDVQNGVILTKKYFRSGRPVRKETVFHPMMMYTYIANGELTRRIACPNCGREGTVADFTEGCPFCDTHYNVEYTARQAGGKFHGDANIRDIRFYVLALLLALAVCLPASLLIVRATGRTFGTFDVLKALLFGLLAALLVFFIFYVLKAFVLTPRAVEKYERQTRLLKRFEADLQGLGITLGAFYTNLQSELARWYYQGPAPKNRDVVDLDILDYDDYAIRTAPDGRSDIRLSVTLREIRARGQGLSARRAKLNATLRPVTGPRQELKGGVNIIQCPGCGASLDVTEAACPHCGQRINYRQRLYMIDPA